jgi:hypothetical protein
VRRECILGMVAKALGHHTTLTDIGKLPIFENDEIELFTQFDELVGEFKGEVFDDVAVRLMMSWGLGR